MNKLLRIKLKKYLWVGLAVVLAGISGLVFLVSQQAVAAQPGERLVTIYQDGQQQSFVTNATSVKDVLNRAHVSLGPLDAVEPSLDTQLVTTSYNINIYRARPVTIIDGNLRLKVVTPYQSPKQIAASAQITTYPEDEMTLSRVDDFVKEGTIGLKMTIKRATPFTFVLYGTSIDTHTQSKTVGDMLKSKGVKLAAQDGTSVPIETPITTGMTVQVWRNGVQTKTEQQPIAFPVRQVQAPDQPIGFKQIQKAGTNGQKLVTYQVNLQNGVEVSRQEIQSVVTQQPEEQVEIVGTKRPAPLGNITAQKAQYMAQAGISSAQWAFVDVVITGESHWNVGSISHNGCYGLGQACPGSKLVSACPNWDSDPACQLRYFSGYANKYGGWEGAYDFWQRNHWW